MAFDKKALEHLAALARIELTSHEEGKFARDLEKILAHFNELRELTTENVVPMAGGTQASNVLREDGVTVGDAPREEEARAVADALPEREKGFLKVPPVFE